MFSKQANDKFTMATMSKRSRKVKMVPKTDKQTKAHGIYIYVGPQYVRIQ